MAEFCQRKLQAPSFILPVIIFIVALMLMNFPYPKIRGPLIHLSLFSIFFAIAGSLMGIWHHPYYEVPLVIAFAMIIFYILSPLYAGRFLDQKDYGKDIEDLRIPSDSEIPPEL